MTAAITDFNQFSSLRLAAEKNDPEVLREVAGQFEALFVQTLFKNMREASLAEPLFGDSDQHEMYQDMLDQQLALNMSSGKGIGLADMLVRQLGGDADIQLQSSRGSGLLASPVPKAAQQQPLWSDPNAFVKEAWPHAQRAAEKLNVAPEAILAQAALETGWGAHVPQRGDGQSSYNLFGIKTGGSWAGDSVGKQTLEYDGEIPRYEAARFRAYPDMGATFDDYAEFLNANPRYANVINKGTDSAAFAEALQDSGYATDPAYASKLKRVMASDTMREALGGLKNSEPLPTSPSGGRLAAGTD